MLHQSNIHSKITVISVKIFFEPKYFLVTRIPRYTIISTFATQPQLIHDFVFYTFLSKGWGRLQHCKRGIHPYLQETKETVMKDSDCKKANGKFRRYDNDLEICHNESANFLNRIFPEMICVEGKQTSSCQGDSGGPFTVMQGAHDQHFLVGVISWSFGCAEVNCQNSTSTHPNPSNSNILYQLSLLPPRVLFLPSSAKAQAPARLR